MTWPPEMLEAYRLSVTMRALECLVDLIVRGEADMLDHTTSHDRCIRIMAYEAMGQC